MSFRNFSIGGLVVAMALVLAGCMLLPGRFVSDVALRRDGTFAFHYKGEIVLAALAQGTSSKSGSSAELDDVFEEKTCTSDDTGEDRPCTANERAAQRKEWEDERAARKADKTREDAQNRKVMQAMLGGIDPEDPKAAQEFATRLSRQAGWLSVIPKGAGKFDVEYAAAGRLDHDFSFPIVEGLPMVIPFVTLIRRNDGTVRMDAPAFSPTAASPPIPGLASMPGEKGKTDVPVIDGVFTLRTDGEVLANNTDEGAQADPAGKRLDWKVSPRTTAAPTALIRIGK